MNSHRKMSTARALLEFAMWAAIYWYLTAPPNDRQISPAVWHRIMRASWVVARTAGQVALAAEKRYHQAVRS